MTVKSLTDTEKTAIAVYWTGRQFTVTELAKLYNRSRRTIIRALEEYGYNPVTPRKKPLPIVVAPDTTPWYKNLADQARAVVWWVTRIFK